VERKTAGLDPLTDAPMAIAGLQNVVRQVKVGGAGLLKVMEVVTGTHAASGVIAIQTLRVAKIAQ